MIRLRLLWELVLPYATFVLLLVAVTMVAGEFLLHRMIVEQELQRLRTAASAAALHREFFRTPADQWRDDLSRLAESTGVHLTVIDDHGTVLADSDGSAKPFQRYDDRPDVRQARQQGVGTLTQDGNRHFATVAVHEAGDHRTVVAGSQAGRSLPNDPLLGFVRADDSIDVASAAVGRWRLWAFVFGLTGGLVGLAFVGRTAARLAAPIESFLREVTPPTTEEPIPRATTPTRLAPMSSVLDALADRLSRLIERLRRDNAGLSASNERLSAVLTGMSEGVLAVDRHDRILFANPALASLLDLSETRLAGRPLWEAIRLPALHDVARQARLEGDVPQIEIELPRTQSVLALRAGRLPGDPSPGVVLVLHDVTELRRLENLRREFVGNVSHELKTPLASIQAYTETLLEGGLDDPEHNVRFLRRIDEQAERLHNLILDLLRLARIEAGTNVFEITRFTAGQIIERSVDDHAAVARSKNVTLTTIPPATPVRIQADRDGLRTILDNLIDNAINYTPAGGSVTVRWGVHDDQAFIEVEDTGLGIPPEHLPRIFERFHRVDQARSREHGGTGLGLAIVKHLAGVFGGRVDVTSDVGRGSTFRILLPLA